MSAHTPGPWRVEQLGGDFFVEGASSLSVAKVHGSDQPTRRANAELVAQAPTLLEQRRRLFEALDELRRWTDDALFPASMVALLAELRPHVKPETKKEQPQ